MAVEFDGVKRTCTRVAVIGMVALVGTACSSIPDWVDPTTWIGGSGPSDTETAPGETPDLATIPDRPAPSSTAEQQQQISDSLAADRARAKYSSDALRGGTEPAAPPPPPASAASNEAVAAASAPPPAPASEPDESQNTDTGEAASQAAAPQTAMDQSRTTTTAELSPPPAAPSYAPPPAPAMAAVSPSDAALGFKPSSAPPLDPSIGQFVPQPVIAHYDQTARAARIAMPVLSASSQAGANPESPRPSGAGAPGAAPTAVVYFPGDGTQLNAEGRLQVRAAVQAFKQSGGQGYIRVVGHSSSRTTDMPLEKHLEVIFDKSQDRANAVAREVIEEGVPANRVLVEAVGDSQPVYYESMPKGEDGNRRAEIFLQS
jgi:outer membrane protein OmpA-like peptidoglycan-associated protein